MFVILWNSGILVEISLLQELEEYIESDLKSNNFTESSEKYFDIDNYAPAVSV